MNLAVFDLDHTLINGDSNELWSYFIVKHSLVKDKDTFLKNCNKFQNMYENGHVDVVSSSKNLIKPIIGKKYTDISKLISKFIEEEIKPRVYKKGLNIVKEYKRNKTKTLIISASLSILVKEIAKLFDTQAIAINLETKNEIYTGELKGILSYKEGKIIALENWLKDYDIKDIFFYSDSINDLPLLEYVKYPIVTNPDKKLLKIAKEKNWQTLNF